MEVMDIVGSKESWCMPMVVECIQDGGDPWTLLDHAAKGKWERAIPLLEKYVIESKEAKKQDEERIFKERNIPQPQPPPSGGEGERQHCTPHCKLTTPNPTQMVITQRMMVGNSYQSTPLRQSMIACQWWMILWKN